MSDGRVAGIMIVLFFLGLFISYIGFVKLRQKRQIENTPTSKIRSLAVGMVEIYGKATSITGPSMAPSAENSACITRCLLRNTGSREKAASGSQYAQMNAKSHLYHR